jgi:lipoprotein NlpD
MWRYLLLIFLLALAGCSNRPPVPVAEHTAPVVVEGGTPGGVSGPAVAGPTVARPGYYIVKKGDTVRRIAQEHGQDFREIAAWNNMTDPGKIEIGKELRVAPPDSAAVVKPIAMAAPIVVVTDSPPVASSANTENLKREPRGGKVAYSDQALAQVRAMEGGGAVAAQSSAQAAENITDKPVSPTVAAVAAIPGGDAIDWTWPVAGKLISEFVEGGAGRESNKGIDLAGRMGEPIQAAAAGKVNYVGSLRGYGDFLVVHHNSEFISVYAHTSKILVKKDQMVTKGQKIAEVGSSDADQPKLHFEIRRQGKPVDPLKLLPAR